MTKAAIWWSATNSILLFCLYFWMLFTNGEFPIIKDRISNVENKVQAIDYHLQCPVDHGDTIVINYYQQSQVVTKKK